MESKYRIFAPAQPQQKLAMIEEASQEDEESALRESLLEDPR